jgi:hypothetical protein
MYLCKNNMIDGVSNDGVWCYLKTGDSSGFADDSARASKKFAGSNADRKRFFIYYLNGHILGQ